MISCFPIGPASPRHHSSKQRAILIASRRVATQHSGSMFIFLIAFLCAAQGWLWGQADSRPPLRVIRYEEDWGFLAKSGQRTDPFDRVKWVRLAPDLHFSFGGETRQRFESFRNEDWATNEPGFDPFLLQRYMMHGELRWRKNVRWFGQLKAGLQTGRDAGPRPVDTNRLDLHQAFVEILPHPRSSALLRVGRQEVSLGSGRLVAIREGPNVRLSFDGVRVIATRRRWNVSLLALRPVQTNPGFFDDSPEHRQALIGAYTTAELSKREPRKLDLYYLWLGRSRARFHSGTGPEERHSLGLRLSGKRSAIDWDYEGVAQFGSFRDQRIRAWTVGTNTGYTFEHIKWKPRIGLKADYTSGDASPGDGRLGTFHALFPKGNYFSQADVLGPYNLIDLHPTLNLEIGRGFSIVHDVDLFWRASTRDGLYNVPGIPIIAPGNSNARYVGHGVNFGFDWKVNRNLTLEGEYQRLLPGRFLRDTGRKSTIDFVALWATFRF